MKTISLLAVVGFLAGASAAAGAATLQESVASQAASGFGHIPDLLPWLSFQKTPWQRILDKTRRGGRYEAGAPASFGLSSTAVRFWQAGRVVNSFKLFGFGKSRRDFAPAYASMTSETWTPGKDGTWQVEQWVIDLNLDGSIRGVPAHFHFTRGDGDPQDDDFTQDRPADALVQTTYGSLIRFWDAYIF